MGMRSIAVAHSPGRVPVWTFLPSAAFCQNSSLVVESDQPKQRTAGWMGMRSIAVAHSPGRAP
eukprot:2785177-Pyramimonas_sp.AAC.1